MRCCNRVDRIGGMNDDGNENADETNLTANANNFNHLWSEWNSNQKIFDDSDYYQTVIHCSEINLRDHRNPEFLFSRFSLSELRIFLIEKMFFS